MLKVDNLSYAYSDKYLFENLGFHLDIKTIIKISGSNGSGKSTFLKNIAGILKNYEGNIYFKDENIKDMSFPNIFYTGHRNGFKNNLTIKENLNNDLRARDLNLNNVKKYFSNFGCDISFSSLLGNYSEGQKKKVLLSLFAASQADLYVLDEPFSNLDAKGIDYLNNVFEKKINDGSSIIFTSHENQGQNFKEINIDDYKNE